MCGASFGGGFRNSTCETLHISLPAGNSVSFTVLLWQVVGDLALSLLEDYPILRDKYLRALVDIVIVHD